MSAGLRSERLVLVALEGIAGIARDDKTFVAKKVPFNIKQIAKMGQYPCVRQCVMLVTEATID